MRQSSGWSGAFVIGSLAAMVACGDSAANGGGGAGGMAGGGGSGGSGGAAPCCGCLCGDPTWSCSNETCLAEDGTAIALVPEAGFLELPGADFVSEHGDGQSPRARVWYSFQPAETDPSNKPLVILFNGITGPALGVLGFNIGHFTFDPIFTDGADFSENAYRWTDFANLIFVDEPGAGFSYHLPRADGSTPDVTFDAYAEAGDYLRIIFRFLERHPQIGDVPIVIVGESGGGIRGTHMTKIMLDYETLVAGGPYQDSELHEEILAFLAARRSDIEPTDWTPEDITQAFSHQIFIDPMLTTYQWQYLTTLDGALPAGCVAGLPGAPAGPDVLDCSETTADAEIVFEHLVRVGTDPEILSQVLRCDMSSIAWMHADARQGAYERKEFAGGEPQDQSKLSEMFGQLEPQDLYYVFNSDDIHQSWDLGPASAGLDENVEHGRVALRTLHDVPTMITNGAYDLRFNAQFLAPSLALYTDVLTSAAWNETEPSSAERPGQLELVYAAGLPYGGGTRVIANPAYLAGHSVSHHAPSELREDVMAFLTGNPL